ncbi:6-phosphogluconate decarboxylating [Fusarium langsethiae]|uniref:phosphogluconate dehydrogenase (NADP(+)-dependent, decarboxylating) n=1 Tax=Fusarium langsethiae TaxID=179993 RepID=A0A0N0V5W4_FUSLA|nr:6-phosphogluconate decarboxylating [Fusarium langsethiae]
MSDNTIGKILYQIRMVGTGSMGSMMSLLFAEKGCHVYYLDISENNTRAAEKIVKGVDEESRVHRQQSYAQLSDEVKSENHPRVVIFSIPHGIPGDRCVKGLRPYLDKGDIFLDCSNEYYVNTERRQADLAIDSIYYVGCGVSWGYQSALTEPSMSPGGDPKALEILMPLLRSVAASGVNGKPRTSPIGPGGSGHYVTMIHNGIEQAIISVISEVWYILIKGIQLSCNDAADVLTKWNMSDELQNTHIIQMGVGINRTQESQGEHVLRNGRHKVARDANTEEMGAWLCEEAVRLHVPAMNMVSAHFFGCTSAGLKRRVADAESSGHPNQPIPIKVGSKNDFIVDLRKATYFCLLLCFVQGLQVIREMDQQREWHIDYPEVLHIWSSSSTIQTGGIINLLKKVYGQSFSPKENLLSNPALADQLASLLPSLKRTVIAAIEADAAVPTMSQSLEYYKYSTSGQLPTQLA